jgi:HSP20 family molecular chaperone IbpA
MLFFTIPLQKNSNEGIYELLGIEDYKQKKRLRSPSDLVNSSPKVRKLDKSDKFEVKLDVIHFRPEEITVKTVGKDLIVEGKHGERLDENGFVSRQFTRRYEMPEDIDLERMSSSLSADGKLFIKAPIKQSSPKERVIPITFEDKSKKTIENSEDGKETKESKESDQNEKVCGA